MMNRKRYFSLMTVALVLFVLSMTVFGETTIVAPILITVSLYLFLGVVVRWCKESERFKNTIFTAIDLFFWLP